MPTENRDDTLSAFTALSVLVLAVMGLANLVPFPAPARSVEGGSGSGSLETRAAAPAARRPPAPTPTPTPPAAPPPPLDMSASPRLARPFPQGTRSPQGTLPESRGGAPSTLSASTQSSSVHRY